MRSLALSISQLILGSMILLPTALAVVTPPAMKGQLPDNVKTAVKATPTPAPAAPAKGNLESTFTNNSSVDTVLTEDLIRSLRDPFQVPNVFVKKGKIMSDLETFQLKDLKLNGVITGPKKLRAMITAPNGKGFFVQIGERIGVRDGKITAIVPEAIRVIEYDVDEKGRRIPEILELRLNGDFVSLTKKEE